MLRALAVHPSQRIRNTGVVWTFFRRKPAPPPVDSPLAGAPRRARLKTYSAQSGYVYQYVYRGHRVAGQTATEYVFSATPDRKNWQLIRVVLDQGTLDTWHSDTGRVLLPVECYAIAKLALFDFFDESRRGEGPESIHLTAEEITKYLDSLGRL